MLHPLQQQVDAIGRRVSRLAIVHGLAWALCVIVAALFVCGLTDYLIRFRDFGVRLICSAAAGSVAAWCVWRFLVPAMRANKNELGVARQLERHFPTLQDRLTSSLAFLSQAADDPTAGSAGLRRTVVAETTAAVERLDFSAAIDARPPRRAIFAALAVCVAVGAICAFDLSAAALATQRLLFPWSGREWPRVNELEFSQRPERLAVGGSFEVELIDRHGRLPDQVTIEFWFDGDDAHQIQRQSMKFFNDRMVYRLDHVTRPFQFRAKGGDDDSMPWLRVELVEPPRVTDARLRVIPPEYTGWPAETVTAPIRALVGSRIEVTGSTTKLLQTASLKTDAKFSSSDDGGTSDKSPRAAPFNVDVQISDDGKNFLLPADPSQPWLVATSGNYWLELLDRDGLPGSETRWNLRAVPDQPPTIAVESPGANAFVTPQATVPLRVMVKDDLATRSVELRFTRSDQTERGEQVVPLFNGPEKAAPAKTNSLAGPHDAGDSHLIEHVWDLSQLVGLAAGATIDFHIVATDYKPQAGQSSPRRLAVISPEELDERIAQRQTYILGQLAELLRMQRDCRSQTMSLEIQWQEAATLGPRDVDQLQSVELNQRQIGRVLAGEGDGVLAQIASLLGDLESNRLETSEAARRMLNLQQVLSRLNADELPVIQRELVNALKLARQRDDADAKRVAPPALGRSLTEAGVHQDHVIETLEKLLGELSQWDSYRRFAREISRLRREQEDVQKQTSDRLASKSTAKDLRELSTGEVAELKRLAERQAELARRLDKILSRMEQARGQLRDFDPVAADTLADALQTAARSAVGGQMRESGRRIEQNRVGQALETQQQIARHLDEMLDVLANRRENELERIAKHLDQAQQELSELSRREGAVKKKFDDAAKLADEAARGRELQRLTKEQRDVAEQAEQLARRLQRLQAQRSGEKVGQAGKQAGQAAESSQQGNAQQALEESTQAQKQLEDAQQQLAQERQQAREDLLREQLARLEQMIAGLAARQKSVVTEAQRLEVLRIEKEGELSEAQLASVRTLAEQQRDIAGEATASLPKLEPTPAFALGLQGAIREMLRAASFLDRRETGSTTQQAAQQAVVRLEQLLAALRKDNSGGGEQSPSEGGDKQQPPGENAVRALEELKLLQLMQQAINRRTRELDATRRKNGPLSEDQEREVADLSQEQGRLADLVAKMVRAMQPAPADDSAVPVDPQGDAPPRPLPEDLDDALQRSLDEAAKKKSSEK